MQLKQIPKPKEKPKPKSKPKPKEKKPKPKPKPKEKRKSNNYTRITIVNSNQDTQIDKYYDRKVNTMLGKIREQNRLISDQKIRFGWNFGDN